MLNTAQWAESGGRKSRLNFVLSLMYLLRISVVIMSIMHAKEAWQVGQEYEIQYHPKNPDLPPGTGHEVTVHSTLSLNTKSSQLTPHISLNTFTHLGIGIGISSHSMASQTKNREQARQEPQQIAKVDRIFVRNEVQRIIINRLSNQLRRHYKRRQVVRQSLILESFLYKRALTLEMYTDLDTLEERVLRVSGAMMAQRHRLMLDVVDEVCDEEGTCSRDTEYFLMMDDDAREEDETRDEGSRDEALRGDKKYMLACNLES
eukprot:scaffold136_cov203-Alexandrium_tamarense.AAC.11